MKNKKVIVINSLARGGSNILWNIFQSHPAVCSPIYETGELFRIAGLPRSEILTTRVMSSLFRSGLFPQVLTERVDHHFYKYKMKTLSHPDNRYKAEGVLYNENEVANSVLCLKTLNSDIRLTPLLAQMYPEIHFVGLIRNGYAVCESWHRRGTAVKSFGNFYHKFAQQMLEDADKYDRYTILRFEDLITDPFGAAEQLFRFAELTPTELPKLRLKSKRTLKADGTHSVNFGQEQRKSWFSPADIQSALDPQVTKNQKDSLTTSDKEYFEQITHGSLKRFGYL